jgi:hypothetical protein
MNCRLIVISLQANRQKHVLGFLATPERAEWWWIVAGVRGFFPAGTKGAIAAVIDHTEELGARLVYADADGSRIIAVDSANDPLGTGLPVHFAIEEADLHVSAMSLAAASN